MKFNCPCDELIFPPALHIPAGLPSLPRQLATFPEFRAAMLAAIAAKLPLKDWRARSSDDFGVMLLEMWAYVCDSISFYDEVIADEVYLRTAQQRSSLRKLVDLLGYIPRPAVAASADLAVLADGRQAIVLPAGTSFRSGAFPGSPPQVFELLTDTKVHPFLNSWTLVPLRPLTIDNGKNLATVTLSSLLLAPSSVNLKAGQIFLFEVVGDPSKKQTRVAKSISDYKAADGATYKKVEWDGPITIPGNTLLTKIKLTTPAQTALLWRDTVPIWSTPILNLGTGFLFLDTIYSQLKSAGTVVLEKAGAMQWFVANSVTDYKITLPAGSDTVIKDKNGVVTAIVTPPPQSVQVTLVRLDALVNDPNHRTPSTLPFTLSGFTDFRILYDFLNAGSVVGPALTTLRPGDPFQLATPFEEPEDRKSPNRFLLEDKNNIGAYVTGGIDFSTGLMNLDQTSKLSRSLTVPVQMYGNVVTASRGETVKSEILGSGDASLSSQSFKLKKSPLTYASSPTSGNDSGVASTLKIYVSGVLWKEVPTFFGMTSDAQVYVIRQNDDGESTITFGDGIRGSRLISGVNNIVASYRFGAGKASPPAGSIHQLGKPVVGIKSVRNPVAAAGGDDAEPANGLRTYAPRSALLLGRAVSILDMEAAAATVAGVRAVRAEWRWNELRQRPVVQVYYIGESGISGTVSQRLRSLSDPTTPIDVAQADPLPITLAIAIEIDPKRLEDDVLRGVRDALMNSDTGLLAPERIGIGLPLFRSRIFETVLDVAGATAVTGLLKDGVAFDPYGISAGAGKYFDLENGTLLLNGKAGVSG